MTKEPTDEPADTGDDPTLREAGAKLRSDARPLDASGIPLTVLARRNRRRGALAGALLAIVVVLAAVLIVDPGSGSTRMPHGRDVANSAPVDKLVASLPAKPVDPTQVKLVSSVKSFPGCDALIGDLRVVGARHVGSQGFGASGPEKFAAVGEAIKSTDQSASVSALPATGPQPDTAAGSVGDGATLGTNVQVSGVDELDHVKAEGSLIYDLDGKGNLRITDATTLAVRSTTKVTAPISAAKGKGSVADVSNAAASLLVSKSHVVVFGSQSETSKAVPGDPSATQSATNYLTLVFLDASDPVHPKITDRVKVEGSLVAARLVGGQIRLVTSSDMADIGMVMPTTPASVPVALDRNRRSVAASSAADWIPDWQRPTGAAQPLVPCDRVHVPDTFAGVEMTSMVAFPIGTGRFAPQATSILAPAETLYAGTDKVAISSHVWVDPADRSKLHFDDWKTAVHEFTFPDSGAPTYVGSGAVEGSTIGQYAFGEVGDAIAVVTTKGTPWSQDPSSGVDLTLLSSKGGGDRDLTITSKVADLAGGNGEVTAVRYLDGRVLIATGTDGRDIQVIDVHDPAHPRRAGKVNLEGTTGYFHPLAADRALLVESRSDTIKGPHGPIGRPWVRAEVLDVSNADTPKVVGSWEVPWSRDGVAADPHAFTYWPERNLAMWGVSDNSLNIQKPNHAGVLDVAKGIERTAWPVASEPLATAAPCPQVNVTDANARTMLPHDAVVLGCTGSSTGEPEWPRYACSAIPTSLVRQYAPDLAGKAKYYQCTPAPQPTVQRVLVVGGRPILLTDQTLEALDPTTFASKKIVYHPTGWQGPYGGPVID